MTKKEHVDLLTRLVINKQITLVEAFELYECEVFDPEMEEEEEEEEEKDEDEFVKNFLEYILNNPTSTTTSATEYFNKKK